MKENITFIERKWFLRLITGILAGLLTWLLAEVLLNIRYRYFEMFLQPLNYLYAAAFGVVLRETLYRASLLLDKRYPWDKKPAGRMTLQLLTGILAAFFWVSAVRLTFKYLVYRGTLIIFMDELVLLVLVVILVLFFNLAGLAVFLNERYRRSLAEVERFRKENAEYQFEMLKLQLNPHFLFNSLNTLSSLVYEDPAGSAEFVRRLSDVYRYVLENRNKELVPLREELEFIRAFSFLLELRFRGMIFFRIEVDNAVLDNKIAPMTLQLLVENAVKHNVVSMRKPLYITIRSQENRISVENNLQPKDEIPGTGVGLKNISSRYAFLSDRKVEIKKDDNLFKVTIPLI